MLRCWERAKRQFTMPWWAQTAPASSGRLPPPPNHFRRFAGLRRQHGLDGLDGLVDLLVGHRLNPSGMLGFHFPRHQERADLHVRRGLLLAHLFNRGRPVLFEVSSEREQGARLNSQNENSPYREVKRAVTNCCGSNF